MAINFKVFTKFGAKDTGVDDQFDKMSKSAKKFGNTSEKAFKKASKSALNFKSVMGGVLAAGAVTKGVNALGTGIATVAEEFLGFDNAVTSASAKFKGLDLTTKEGQKTLEDLRKTARKVGAETELNAKQAAEGLDFLALSGANAEQAMALLPGVTNLATVAQVELGEATDIATDSLGAFGLMTKDTEQLTANFNRVQDVMAKTTATSNTNLTDLFEAVQKGAPAFTAAGQNLETFNALAGIMANAGLKGSESGTQLRNVMLRLAKPTKESQDALDALGVTTRDSQGNFLDVVDILAQMEKGLIGKGSAERSAALATIFGARAVTGINILLKEGTESIRGYRSELEAAGGSSQQMADIMRGSLTNQLASLKSAAIEVGFQLFEAFSGEGATAIQVFTQILRDTDLTPLIEGIRTVAGGIHSIVSAVVAWEEKHGVFANLADLITGSVIPIFEKLWGIAKNVFDLFAATGVFDALGQDLNILIDVFEVVFDKFNQFLGFVEKITESPEIMKAEFESIKDSLMNSITSPFEGAADTLAGIPVIGKLFRDETEAPQAPPRQPPNRVQVEARQQVNVGGRIDIAGAPAGSTATPEQGSQIDMNMMGNPRKAA